MNLENWLKPLNRRRISERQFSDVSTDGVPTAPAIERTANAGEISAPVYQDDETAPKMRTGRQRVISNQPVTETPTANPMSQLDVLLQKRSEMTDKSNPNYQPVVNKNPGIKGRLVDILREAMIGGGQIAGQGGSKGQIVGGMLAGGAGGFIKPELPEMRQRARDVADVDDQIKNQQAVSDWLNKTQRQQVETQNIITDNAANQQKIEDNKLYKEGYLKELGESRKSREETNKMRVIAGLINKQPQIDVNDPNQASLVEAAQAAGLPITDRNAKLTQKPVQDAETGEWSVIITNPLDPSAKPVSVPVTLSEDGKRFVSKSPTKVMAEAGMIRQNDQQTFTAQEKQKDREFTARRDAAANQMKVALENLKHAQDLEKQALGNEAKAAAQKATIEARENLLRLRKEYDDLKP